MLAAGLRPARCTFQFGKILQPVAGAHGRAPLQALRGSGDNSEVPNPNSARNSRLDPSPHRTSVERFSTPSVSEEFLKPGLCIGFRHEVPQAYSCSTPRSPRKHNAVSADDCGTGVDNLCIIRVRALSALLSSLSPPHTFCLLYNPNCVKATDTRTGSSGRLGPQ